MERGRIGRVLVASLHQAIADHAPTRLEFYENWLNSEGFRHGTIGLAAMSGVLGFLRREETYELIVTRAGEYAADWTLANRRGLQHRLQALLPRRFRAKRSLRLVRELVRATYPGTRCLVRLRRGRLLIELRGSVFCEVREPLSMPLCGYYLAAANRILRGTGTAAVAAIAGCRATGGRSCVYTAALNGREMAAAAEGMTT